MSKHFGFNGLCSSSLTLSIPVQCGPAGHIFAMLYSHNCACLVCLYCHLFSEGYSFSVFVCRLSAGLWTGAAIVHGVILKIPSYIKVYAKEIFAPFFNIKSKHKTLMTLNNCHWNVIWIKHLKVKLSPELEVSLNLLGAVSHFWKVHICIPEPICDL